MYLISFLSPFSSRISKITLRKGALSFRIEEIKNIESILEAGGYYFSAYNELLIALTRLFFRASKLNFNTAITIWFYRSFIDLVLKNQRDWILFTESLLKQANQIQRDIYNNFSPNEIIYQKTYQLSSWQTSLASIVKRNVSEPDIMILKDISTQLTDLRLHINNTKRDSRHFQERLKHVRNKSIDLKRKTRSRINPLIRNHIIFIDSIKDEAIQEKYKGNFDEAISLLFTSDLFISLTCSYSNALQELSQLNQILNHLDSETKKYAKNLKSELNDFSILLDEKISSALIKNAIERIDSIKQRILEIISIYGKDVADATKNLELSYKSLLTIGNKLDSLENYYLNEEPLIIEYREVFDIYKNDTNYLRKNPSEITKWVQRVNKLSSAVATWHFTIQQTFEYKNHAFEAYNLFTSSLLNQMVQKWKFAQIAVDSELALIHKLDTLLPQAKCFEDIKTRCEESTNQIEHSTIKLKPIKNQLLFCNQNYKKIHTLLNHLGKADIPDEHKKGGLLLLISSLRDETKSALDAQTYEEASEHLKNLLNRVELRTSEYINSSNIYQSIKGDLYNMGDTFHLSGDFRGSNLNLKSRLDNVQQNIGQIPHGHITDKDELRQLIEKLMKALETIPAENKEMATQDAETIVSMSESLVELAESEKPNQNLIQLASEKLKQAAKNLESIAPSILNIATQVIITFSKIVTS